MGGAECVQSAVRSETRRHQRVEFEGRAWCDSDRLTLYLKVSNLSRGGMFIQTGSPFPVGRALRVSFECESEPIVADVLVVWSGRALGGGPGIGCRLVSFAHGEDDYGRLVARLERSA